MLSDLTPTVVPDVVFKVRLRSTKNFKTHTLKMSTYHIGKDTGHDFLSKLSIELRLHCQREKRSDSIRKDVWQQLSIESILIKILILSSNRTINIIVIELFLDTLVDH